MKKATIVSINGELKARVIKDFILDLPQYNYYPLFNHQKEWLKEGMEVEGEIVFSNGFKILNGERLVSMNLSSYKNYFKVSLSQSPVNEGTATDKKEANKPKVGDIMILDEGYSNSSEVTVHSVSEIGLTTKVTDGDSVWPVMSVRLTKKK